MVMPTRHGQPIDVGPADAATVCAWARTALPRPVLVVDDEPGTRDVLARWLERRGYAVTTASSADEALMRMNGEPAAVVLCDVRMPGHDGLWLLARLRDEYPATAVVMATGFTDVGPAIASLRRGVVDYLTKPFTPDQLGEAVRRAMDWHMNAASERQWAEQLEQEAAEREERLRAVIAGLAINSDEGVNELLSQHTADNEAAYAHCRRVASLVVLLCDRMGRSDREKRVLRRAALLHDIGKSALPPAVVRKPAPLTAEEDLLVRTHPIRAWRLLKDVPFLAEAAPIVRSVHERPDGGGFPDGSDGTKIPLGSLIISIANSYDAMTTGRVYRDPLPPGEALLGLERHAGTKFDAALVPLFVSVLRAA
jgi:putative nucleotidyltransferase with HDIG domain